jgi:Phosphomannomutase
LQKLANIDGILDSQLYLCAYFYFSQYPPSLLNGKYSVTRVRDLTTGYDSGTADHKATLPTSKSSEMITFTFDNGLVATLRTSGTEPKIKYYTELVASPDLK